MGYTLHRELRKALGPDITPLERLVALQIALDARDPNAPPDPSDSRKPRESRIKLENLAAWTGAKDAKVVRKMLQRLAGAGWEFRVPLGKDKNGNLLYAVPGKVLNFRVPETPEGGQGVAGATPSSEREGGTTVPPKGGPVFPQGGTVVPPYVLPPTSKAVLPPESSNASLSPPVPRATAHAERETLITRAMREHQATRDEIEAIWEDAHDEGRGMKTLRAWVTKCPDDIAQRIADYRQEAEYQAHDAEYAALGTCDFHLLPHPCRGCAADAKAADSA